ncbi:MAG: BamA/TamA family outer membrane protein, partial [Gemmatimonadales bacterium]
VDLHTTDQADVAEIVQAQGGRTTVRLESGGRPYFSRTFDRRETREIRLYLQGGDDRAIVRGADGGPQLRIIGGGGNDTLVDSATGGVTRFYDDRGTNRFVGSPSSIHMKPYAAPPVDTLTLGRPRDQGARWVPLTWLSFGPDVGLFMGAGAIRTGYGFRHAPYRTRLMFRAGYATGAASYRAELVEELRDFPGRASTSIQLRLSGIEVVRFYGFGNESVDTGSTTFYKVTQQQYLFAPTVTWPVSAATRLSLGALLKHADSDPDSTRFIGVLRPYGIGPFSQVGVTGGIRLDTRDYPAWASRGHFVSVSGSAYPAALDVARGFGQVSAEAATYLTVPGGPTLALRVAGSRVFGEYPFHEAAYLGGASTVRGFPENRFAGDAVLFGNAELRAGLGRVYALLPTEIGVFVLADMGRAYLEGETSDTWHGAAGGGLSFAFLNRASTLTIAVARSAERTGVFVRAGFAY